MFPRTSLAILGLAILLAALPANAATASAPAGAISVVGSNKQQQQQRAIFDDPFFFDL
jgi:hypothetical protein